MSAAMKKKSSFTPLKIISLILIACVVVIGAGLVYVIYFDNSPVEIMELNANGANVLSNTELAGNIPNSNISDKTKFFLLTDKGKTFVSVSDKKNDFSNLKI